MLKERYYFSHDYNARNDKKISALVREFKSSGYGIYWCTAEMLHEENGELELDDLTISAISKDLNEDFDLVKQVINKCVSHFKLFFISTDNVLTANRVDRNLNKRKEISKIRSNAGKAGANAKQMLAIAEQNIAKERKGKEIKEIKEIKGNKEELYKNMPTSKDFNGLPDIQIGAITQLLKITKQIDVSPNDISGLWEVFKIQNLTGKKTYCTKDDVYSHFINWAKDKRIDVKKTIEKNKGIFL